MKSFVLLAFFCVLLTTCMPSSAKPSKDIKGISDLIETLKGWIGLSKSSTFPADKDNLPEKSISVKEEGTSPFIMPTLPTLPSVQIIGSLPLDKRINQYREFEHNLLLTEDQALSTLEEETNQKINAILKDSRVTDLMIKNPEVDLEDLPKDLYESILALIQAEEARMSTVMDETDQHLGQEAIRLDVRESLALQELPRQEEREKKLDDIKAKAGQKIESLKESVASTTMSSIPEK